ncbi:HAD family hydrolase [Jannaschia rubra]|uniref:HAD family hydrolase n=1 Tax=Jannaschia rubra TaxID=282197 RepID=UPI0024903D56|nr:HAD-IA family hydrolase [Jannaschia rubra]
MDDFDLVILDCDGVLIDSEGLSGAVLIDALAEVGVAIDFDDFRTRMVGRSFPTVAAEIRAAHGIDLPPAFERDYRARLLARFEAELRVTPGVEAMLDALRVPACVATSSSPARVARSLELTGLAGRLPHVFTASQVARGKPAPDLFLFAARQMGAAAARCLVIEDSLPGIEAAQAAGMAVVRYTGGVHLAGRDLKHGPEVPVLDDWRAFPAMMARA